MDVFTLRYDKHMCKGENAGAAVQETVCYEVRTGLERQRKPGRQSVFRRPLLRRQWLCSSEIPCPSAPGIVPFAVFQEDRARVKVERTRAEGVESKVNKNRSSSRHELLRPRRKQFACRSSKTVGARLQEILQRNPPLHETSRPRRQLLSNCDKSCCAHT